MLMPLTGIIPAAPTPFCESGSVNPDAIRLLAKFYRDQRNAGVFVCGTTGECHSLSLDERRTITEAWCDAAPQELPVIVHVGSNALPDAVELARHAQQCGADAIAAMTPFFFKPSLEEVVEFCESIAAAAPDLPFYYYHIPVMTGVDLPVAEFLVRGSARIPTLAGVKFSNSNMKALQECLTIDGGRFDVLFGHDEMLLAGLSLGVCGAIGGTYNYATPLYHRLIAAFEAGDLETARREQAKSVALVNALIGVGFIPASKAVMKMIGIDCGPVRLPLRNVDESELHQLARETSIADCLVEQRHFFV